MTTPSLSDRIKSFVEATEELERMEQPCKDKVNRALSLALEIVIDAQKQSLEYQDQTLEYFNTSERLAAKVELLKNNNHDLAEFLFKSVPPTHNIAGQA